MTLEVTHEFESQAADGSDSSKVNATRWNANHVLRQDTERILGRVSSGTGSTEELTADQVRTFLGLVIGTNVQAYDANLASWAGVTRASGLDTFAATPSSANLRALLTDETGTGAAVFGTSPAFTTNIRLPDGSAAAPALAFASDQTKGLYSASSNFIGVAIAGDLVLSIGATSLQLSAANHGIDLGSPTSSNTPYMDFHSSGNSVDYDARIIASNGDATEGGGDLTLTGTWNITPRASSLKRGLYIEQTPSGSGADGLNVITMASDNRAITSDASGSAMHVSHVFGGSAMRGGRNSLWVQAQFNSATHASNGNRNYTGGALWATASDDDGGGSGTEKGALFGAHPLGKLLAGATHWLHVSGMESDIGIATGASAKHKSGINISALADDAVKGSTTDTALWIQNQSGAVGFDNALLISFDSSVQTVSTTGTLIATRGTNTVNGGIDLSTLTYTTFSFKAPGFTVAGLGRTTIYQNDTSEFPQLTLEQDGTGDAVISFLLTETRQWNMGIDNSDSDSFKLTPQNDGFAAPVWAITAAGAMNVLASMSVAGTQVVSTRKTGWTAATGTAARTTFATYSAPDITNPPTETEVQNIADHVQILSQRMKALIDDLHGTAGHGLIGT